MGSSLVYVGYQALVNVSLVSHLQSSLLHSEGMSSFSVKDILNLPESGSCRQVGFDLAPELEITRKETEEFCCDVPLSLGHTNMCIQEDNTPLSGRWKVFRNFSNGHS